MKLLIGPVRRGLRCGCCSGSRRSSGSSSCRRCSIDIMTISVGMAMMALR